MLFVKEREVGPWHLLLCLTAMICSLAVPSGRASLEHSAPCWFSLPPQHLNCICLWMRHHRPAPTLMPGAKSRPQMQHLWHLVGAHTWQAAHQREPVHASFIIYYFLFRLCSTSSLLASPRETSHGAVTSKGLLMALCKSEESGQDRRFEVTRGVSEGCLKQSHCSPRWALVQSEHTCLTRVKGPIPAPRAWQAWAACKAR